MSKMPSRRVKKWETAVTVVTIGSGVGGIVLCYYLLDTATVPDGRNGDAGLVAQALGLLGFVIVTSLAVMASLVTGMAAGFAIAMPALRFGLNRTEARHFFERFAEPNSLQPRWATSVAGAITVPGRLLASLLYRERM